MKLFAADFPDGFDQKLTERKMRWYITRGNREARKRLTKIAVTRTAPRGARPGCVKAKVVAALPPGSYRFRATFCVGVGPRQGRRGRGSAASPVPSVRR